MLRLINVPMPDDKVKCVVDAIVGDETFKTIETSCNGFRPTGFSLFVGAFVSSERDLKLISVSSNPLLGSSAGTSLAKCFRGGSLGWPRLKYLSLESCNIGDAGITDLSESIADCCTALEGVKVARNRISSRGAVALARAILACKLVEVDLSWNAIGPKAAPELAKCLKNSSSALRDLNLAYNACKEGATSIVTAAFKSGALVTLDLSGNAITPQIAATFRAPLLAAARAQTRPSLESLILCGNEAISKLGVLPLRDDTTITDDVREYLDILVSV